jgi:hypothetical protein
VAGKILQNEVISLFDIIQENVDNKPFKFKGIAMIKDSISGNGRRYSGALVESTVNNVKSIIEANGAYPLTVMADHPNGFTSNKTLTTVGKITDMYMEGNNAIIEAEIANTSVGKDVQELIRGKFVEGLSIRASKAKMKKMNIDGRSVNDVLEMELNGVDLVTNPGVKGARVLDILESAENSGVFISIAEEEIVDIEEDKMDYSKITLEELKANRKDLVESLKVEFKPVFESELKVNELQESVDNLTSDKTELQGKLDESEKTHKELKESFDAKEAELKEAQKQLQEIKEAEEAAKLAEEKAKREKHIAEKVTELKFADSVKAKIKEEVSTLESIEEIDAKIAEKVEFLNMVIKESTGVDISGKGHSSEKNKKDDQDFMDLVMKY